MHSPEVQRPTSRDNLALRAAHEGDRSVTRAQGQRKHALGVGRLVFICSQKVVQSLVSRLL